MRAALVNGDATPVLPLLQGESTSAKRLAIHQRHYQASLVNALLTKFPGCVWLLGERFVTEAARVYVRATPPTEPCIAEYGESFPRFLATRPESAALPYLQSFAELEWHLGRIAIAVERAPTQMEAFAAIDPSLLPDASVELQPGVSYLAASWPVDELIQLFLAERRPEHFVFEPQPVALELRGARGSFELKRLDRASFAFRATIAGGESIATAAECALAHDAQFDVGQALSALVAERLVVAVAAPSAGAYP
jgi:hypothetical protein